jgi:hypothetical protein
MWPFRNISVSSAEGDVSPKQQGLFGRGRGRLELMEYCESYGGAVLPLPENPGDPYKKVQFGRLAQPCLAADVIFIRDSMDFKGRSDQG